MQKFQTLTSFPVGISSATVVECFKYFWDICLQKLCRSPLLLGGAGWVNQTDESIKMKASNLNSKWWPCPWPRHWIVQLVTWLSHVSVDKSPTFYVHLWKPNTTVDTSYVQSNDVAVGIYKVGYIQLVEQRDADTVLTIIQNFVAPGINIWSNSGRS